MYRLWQCTELRDLQTKNISTSEGNTINFIFLPWHLIVWIFFEIMARKMQLSWPQKPKGKSELKKNIFYWTNKGQPFFETVL